MALDFPSNPTLDQTYTLGGNTWKWDGTSWASNNYVLVSGIVSVPQGGTGATTATDALTSLGAYPASNPSGYTSNTGTVTSVGGTGTVNGITLTGTLTTSGNLTLGGTLSGVDLASQITGTLGAANGGTGLSASGAAGNVLTSDGTAWTSQPPAAGGITYTAVKTSSYSAANSEGVQTDTSGGAFTVTLPATPAVGDQVIVVDSAGSWATNNLTVGRNGSTIEGDASDLICDISGVSVQFVYNGTTWDVFTQAGGAAPTASGGFSNIEVFTSSGTFTIPAGITKIKVTVVGGGGGASGANGTGSGGGGGGGGAAIKILSGLTPSNTLTVTVGSGGNGSAYTSTGGGGGSSSLASGTETITTISATGGSGGRSNGSLQGSTGGAGSGGDLNIRGGSSQGGSTTSAGSTGQGGNSILGGGAAAMSSFGTDGGLYGGGGGSRIYTSTGYGGDGAAGVVIIEY